MPLVAVRVGLGLVALASGALAGFMIVHDHPQPIPVAQPTPPPPPPPAPTKRAIPTVTVAAVSACAKGVFVNERDVTVQTTTAWLDVPALAKTQKKPHLHPRDGDVDPAYVALGAELELHDRDGQPLERIRFDAPRAPAVSGNGRVVAAHDLDDADETPCALAPKSATVWRTDPMVIEVRYTVAPSCPRCARCCRCRGPTACPTCNHRRDGRRRRQ